MRIVFAGTPEFAATALAALIAARHEVVLVLTQPDRPSGRGMQVRPTPVKALATRHGIAVAQPGGLRVAGRHDADARAALALLAATPHDAMVVAAYGLILPPSVLAIPPLGCVNIHASLLPRWRGAAPIQRAIEAGDAETGITIMQMDAGLDTGAVLLVRTLPIAADDTGATLTARLAVLGGDAIVAALAALAAGTLAALPQHAPGDEERVTYAAKLTRGEGALDFTQGTRALVDRIRAFDPWPGCSADLAPGSPFKIWRAVAVPPTVVTAWAAGPARPGAVLGFTTRFPSPDGALVVATGDGAIALAELQKPGGKRLPARAFAHEFRALPQSVTGDNIRQ